MWSRSTFQLYCSVFFWLHYSRRIVKSKVMRLVYQHKVNMGFDQIERAQCPINILLIRIGVQKTKVYFVCYPDRI